MLKILLLRDFIEMKRNFISYLVILSLFPMLLHLLIVIPFSLAFSNLLEIRYLNWSVIGVWFVSSSFVSFSLAISKIKKMKFDSMQLESLFKTPISNVQIVCSVVIFSVLVGSIEAFISMIFTTLVNNQYLNYFDYAIIFLQLFPSLIFFTLLSILIGQFVKMNLTLIGISVFIFLIMSFGIGAFIPLEAYPEIVKNVTSYFPISGLINNGHKVLFNMVITPYYFLLSMFFNLVLFLFLISVVNKLFRK